MLEAYVRANENEHTEEKEVKRVNRKMNGKVNRVRVNGNVNTR